MRFLRTHPRLRSHSVRLRLCSSAQPISRTGSLLRVKLRRTQYEHMFSACPQARTLLDVVGMSQTCHERTWPYSFNDLVGAREQCRRYREAEGLRCLEIDRQLEFCWLLHR